MDLEDWAKLMNYVKNCLDKGFTEEEIKEELLASQWDKDCIDTVFDYLKERKN